jgi:hypothetical protein
MKIYIVFIGLLIININFMAFNQEMGHYIMLQNLFKATSEECAAQAALLLDEGEYYKGYVVFLKDEEDSERALESACEKIGLSEGYTLTLDYEDDATYYDSNNLDENPRVTATIKIDVSSLFTTKIFRETIIERSSCYEIL